MWILLVTLMVTPVKGEYENSLGVPAIIFSTLGIALGPRLMDLDNSVDIAFLSIPFSLAAGYAADEHYPARVFSSVELEVSFAYYFIKGGEFHTLRLKKFPENYYSTRLTMHFYPSRRLGIALRLSSIEVFYRLKTLRDEDVGFLDMKIHNLLESLLMIRVLQTNSMRFFLYGGIETFGKNGEMSARPGYLIFPFIPVFSTSQIDGLYFKSYTAGGEVKIFRKRAFLGLSVEYSVLEFSPSNKSYYFTLSGGLGYAL